jgi:uncharacterized membrane protein
VFSPVTVRAQHDALLDFFFEALTADRPSLASDRKAFRRWIYMMEVETHGIGLAASGTGRFLRLHPCRYLGPP